ncbi:hypothetical protein LIER_27360 [Lithospermum erythrorhizon]|uniref:Uncharacterized protein n=1 Tax=Lithospermum erythrorhizon TaxID=34254 RepID=A0AAV3RDR7_LITER
MCGVVVVIAVQRSPVVCLHIDLVISPPPAFPGNATLFVGKHSITIKLQLVFISTANYRKLNEWFWICADKVGHKHCNEESNIAGLQWIVNITKWSFDAKYHQMVGLGL